MNRKRNELHMVVFEVDYDNKTIVLNTNPKTVISKKIENFRIAVLAKSNVKYFYFQQLWQHLDNFRKYLSDKGFAGEIIYNMQNLDGDVPKRILQKCKFGV